MLVAPILGENTPEIACAGNLVAQFETMTGEGLAPPLVGLVNQVIDEHLKVDESWLFLFYNLNKVSKFQVVFLEPHLSNGFL